ncbi:hypothetical protein F960_02308 [Acinetobacter gerneri DSM 14967 = CIP 107464 = MTCC 9824]|uniref:Uncharacterized protein n=2 Tax=Acinetobacter gerneri TaxID=202952 RepID=N8Y9F9_9GAMM|nr:hypothetical protein F960_02308 [Acinetobacter gerneri DSM 14967 = CIP 107464 = MTCC 9824]
MILMRLMNKYQFLSCISMLYLQRLEFTLSPFERIVFFRLFLTFGYKQFRKKDIKIIALKIDIHHLKLEEAFSGLVKKFILVADDNDHIGVNRGYLKQLNQQRKIKSRIQRLREHPKSDFLLQLFEKLFQIKISHKQKKSQQLLAMDYKQWLVLVNLVFLSDRDGVVLGAGTHELTYFTGLSRFALLRCMTYLFKEGILRSKINGTLNNGYLNFVSSIYFLNLSHPIWEEKRIYGRYLIFNHPQQIPMLNRLLEALNTWNPDESTINFEQLEFILNFYKESDLAANVGFFQSDECSIPHLLQAARHWNTGFHQEFHLSRGYVANKKKLSLNTNELNFKRLDYIFRYLASHYPNMAPVIHPPQSQMVPANVKSKIKKMFKKVEITEQVERKAATHQIRLSEIMEAQNQLKQEIMSLLVQYAYQSELRLVFDVLVEVIGLNNFSRVVPLGCSDEFATHKIYFNPDPYLKKDELYLIDYAETMFSELKTPISSTFKIVKAYKSSIKQIDFDLKEQLEWGLLSQQCLGQDQFD